MVYSACIYWARRRPLLEGIPEEVHREQQHWAACWLHWSRETASWRRSLTTMIHLGDAAKSLVLSKTASWTSTHGNFSGSLTLLEAVGTFLKWSRKMRRRTTVAAKVYKCAMNGYWSANQLTQLKLCPRLTVSLDTAFKEWRAVAVL